MHFSKTYTQLLLSLPHELSDSAIDYRQLKKQLHRVVHELSSIGFSPATLHELLEASDAPHATQDEDRINADIPSLSLESLDNNSALQHPLSTLLQVFSVSKVAYEVSNTPRGIEARLRCIIHPAPSTEGEDRVPSKAVQQDAELIQKALAARELVIQLMSDRAFFELLRDALQTLSAHLSILQSGFISSVHALSRDILLVARPVSSISHFEAYSQSANASHIRIPSRAFANDKASDLYPWRDALRMYIEAEIFESVAESSRGTRSMEDSEARLKRYRDQTMQSNQKGHHPSLNFRRSQANFETFLQLNLFVLEVKKFHFASAEATRKILKKHTKHTGLPEAAQTLSDLLPLSRPDTASFSRVLVQAIFELVLPVVPHVDDYVCAICTGIAFKPIRLFCGHLFCVRCLVKMQKRREGLCPMCRSPTVLTADRSNVDWALLNFMRDWFPWECQEKLKQDQREVEEEVFREMGLRPPRCVIS